MIQVSLDVSSSHLTGLTEFFHVHQVFVNVILSVVDMMNLGKASAVGYKTIGLYLITTIGACVLGIVGTLIMKGKYEQKIFTESGPSYVSFTCNNPDSYIMEGPDGTLMCSSSYESEDSIDFILNDLNNAFVKKGGSSLTDISLSDTVYQGVFLKLVTDNIIDAFAAANFAGIIVFAIVFGIGLSVVLHRMHGSGKDSSVVIKFLEEVDGVLLQMINWIIMVTPCKYKTTTRETDYLTLFWNVLLLIIPAFVNSRCSQSHYQGCWWTRKLG